MRIFDIVGILILGVVCLGFMFGFAIIVAAIDVVGPTKKNKKEIDYE